MDRFKTVSVFLKCIPKSIILFAALSLNTLASQNTQDSDLDGVPDHIDQCPDTPFFAKVDANGCTTQILFLPTEGEYDAWVATFGFSRFNDYTKSTKRTQNTLSTQISYFRNAWSFSVRGGYFRTDTKQSPIDTTLKIKKRFKPSAKWRITAGAGLRLAHAQIKGNRTDIHLYLSSTYYPAPHWSIYLGERYSIIRDTSDRFEIQNTHTAYIGAGYFLTKKLQISLYYTYVQSRFRHKQADKLIDTGIYYSLDDRIFFTGSYGRDTQMPKEVIRFSIGFTF